MRLNAGGVRELHWHKAAEWAYMLYGSARITAVDAQGRNFVDDVGVGDLWYFPAGIPHSIQGLGPDGCEFLLVFDDGDFDEDNTFLLSDWFKHTPNDVLAQEFRRAGFARSAIRPTRASATSSRPPAGPAQLRQDCGRAPVPQQLQPPAAGAGRRSGRRAERCGSPIPSVFPASTTIAAALVEVDPGGCASCTGIPTPTNGSTTSRARRAWACSPLRARRAPSTTMPATSAMCRSRWATMSRTPATTPLRFLEMFKSSYYADVSLDSGWR